MTGYVQSELGMTSQNVQSSKRKGKHIKLYDKQPSLWGIKNLVFDICLFICMNNMCNITTGKY